MSKDTKFQGTSLPFQNMFCPTAWGDCTNNFKLGILFQNSALLCIQLLTWVCLIWPKPSCKAQWNGEENKADRRRGGKTALGSEQAWSSPSPRGQWETEKNGGNCWLWSHLWYPSDPRGYGIGEGEEGSEFRDWRLAVLDVEYTVKCHSWLYGCPRPLWSSTFRASLPRRFISSSLCLRPRPLRQSLGKTVPFSRPSFVLREKKIHVFVIHPFSKCPSSFGTVPR